MTFGFYRIVCDAAYALIVLSAALAMMACALHMLHVQIASVIATAKWAVLRRELFGEDDEDDLEEEDADDEEATDGDDV